MKIQITLEIKPTGKPYTHGNPEPGSRISPIAIAKHISGAIHTYLDEWDREEWWEIKDLQCSYER